jgi:hypothetical protein
MVNDGKSSYINCCSLSFWSLLSLSFLCKTEPPNRNLSHGSPEACSYRTSGTMHCSASNSLGAQSGHTFSLHKRILPDPDPASIPHPITIYYIDLYSAIVKPATWAQEQLALAGASIQTQISHSFQVTWDWHSPQLFRRIRQPSGSGSWLPPDLELQIVGSTIHIPERRENLFPSGTSSSSHFASSNGPRQPPWLHLPLPKLAGVLAGQLSGCWCCHTSDAGGILPRIWSDGSGNIKW